MAQIAEIIARIKSDAQSSKKAISDVEALKQAVAKAKAETENWDAALEATTSQLIKLARQKELGGVVDEFKGAVTQAKSLDGQLDNVIARLRDIGATEDEVAGVVRQLNNAAESAERLGNAPPPKTFNSVEQGRLAGDTGSLLSAVGGLNLLGDSGALFSELGQIGDIVQYVPQATDSLNKLAASMGTSTTGLIGAAGLAGVGVAALTMLMQELEKQALRAKEETRAAFLAQLGVEQAIASGATTEQLKQIATDAEAQRTAIANQLAKYQPLVDKYRTTLEGLGGAITSASGQRGIFIQELNRQVEEASGGALTSIEGLIEEVNKLEAESAGLGTTIEDVNRAIDAGRTGNADFAASAEERAKVQEAADQRAVISIQARTQAEANAVEFAKTATVESVDARIAALQDEQNRLVNQNGELIALGTEAAYAQAQLNLVRIEEIGALIEETSATRESVAAREAETQAIERQLSSIDAVIRSQIEQQTLIENATVSQIRDRQRAIEIEREAIESQLAELEALAEQSDEGKDKLAQYQQRLEELNGEAASLDLATPAAQMRTLADNAEQVAKATQTLNDDLAKLASARDSRLSELATKLEEGLGDLGAEFAEAQTKQREGDLKELEKFNQDEQDRVKEHRRALKQIERQFDTSQAQAIQDRDAVALDRAITARDDAKAAEIEKFNLESEQRKRDLEELKKTQSAERTELFNSYQKKYNALIDANRKEVAATQSKYQQDVAARQAAFSQQQQQLQTALNQELGIRNSAFSTMLNQASTFAGKLIQIGNSLTSGGTQQQRQIITPTYTYQPNYTPIGRAVGGSTPAGMLTRINEQGIESGVNDRGDFAIFSRPTTVFTAKQTQGMMGGLNIPINISGMGMTQTQIRREVDQRLSKTLSEAGIPA